MSTPGFTAENSLSKGGGHYYAAAAFAQAPVAILQEISMPVSLGMRVPAGKFTQRFNVAFFPVRSTRMPRHQLDCVVQVCGFEHENSAQLLFRLGIRAIGDGHLAVLRSQRDGVPRTLERFPAGKVTVLPQHVVVGKALIEHSVALAVRYRLPLLLFDRR
jgi:hypothetical protein